MKHIRSEILDFIRASETLLSPVSLEGPLSQEERELVAYYAQSLVQEFATVLNISGLA